MIPTWYTNLESLSNSLSSRFCCSRVNEPVKAWDIKRRASEPAPLWIQTVPSYAITWSDSPTGSNQTSSSKPNMGGASRTNSGPIDCWTAGWFPEKSASVSFLRVLFSGREESIPSLNSGIDKIAGILLLLRGLHSESRSVTLSCRAVMSAGGMLESKFNICLNDFLYICGCSKELLQWSYEILLITITSFCGLTISWDRYIFSGWVNLGRCTGRSLFAVALESSEFLRAIRVRQMPVNNNQRKKIVTSKLINTDENGWKFCWSGLNNSYNKRMAASRCVGEGRRSEFWRSMTKAFPTGRINQMKKIQGIQT